MYCKSAYHLAQHFTKSNRNHAYMHFTEAPQGSARRRVNGKIASYFNEIIVLSRKRSDPSIPKISMFYECAYNLAQHFPKSNRYLSYIHFSEASHGSACRRVNGQIASYFQEIIFIPRKRSHPSISYLCFTKLHYHAQHITTSNRYHTYIHFSGASQCARRRVNADIANYFAK